MTFRPEPDREFFVCDCGHSNHVMFVEIWPKENGHPPYLTFNILLNNAPLRRRIRQAIRYLLGRPADWNTWDEIIVDRPDAERLAALVNGYLELQNEITGEGEAGKVD